MGKTKTKIWKKLLLITVLLVVVFIKAPLTESRDMRGADLAISNLSIGTENVFAAKLEKDSEASKKLNGMITTLVAVQSFLNKLLWPVLVMIGGLLDNSLLFGSGMEARMREVWIPIRNIVNILFVIVLVGIALYNVLGLGDESGNYSLKAILPKLILGIIAVNFSFLGIKVFLDVINVFTVSIFALPDQVGEGIGDIDAFKNDKNVMKNFCKMVQGVSLSDSGVSEEEIKAMADKKIFETIKLDSAYASVIKKNGITNIAKLKAYVNNHPLEGISLSYKKYVSGEICRGEKLTDTGVLFLKKYSSQNAALAMAISMGKVVFYEDVTADLKADPNLERLFTSATFSLLLYLVYAASFVALFAVLLGRLIIMWLAIVLSPILMITMFVPALKEQIKGFGQISEQFMKNAVAPIGIALSMTIGWIMLKAMQSVNKVSSGFLSPQAKIFDGLNGIPVVGLNTLQDLVVALGTIAVVWIGVFAAAEDSIAAPVTNVMKDGLKKVGSFLGTLPLKHLSVIPITLPGQDTDNYTPSQVMSAISELGRRDIENSQKLINKVWGKSTGPEQWSNIGSANDALKFLEKNEVKNNLKNHHDAFKNWFNKANTADRRLINKELGQKNVGDFINDEKNTAGILKKLRSDAVRSKYTETPSSDSSSSSSSSKARKITAKAPETLTSVSALKGDTKTEKTINLSTVLSTADLNEVTTILNNKTPNIIALKKVLTKIATNVKGIDIEGAGSVATVETYKEIFNDNGVTAIINALGSKEAFEELLINAPVPKP